MSRPDESAMRKLVWTRKDAVDAKMAEDGFASLPEQERDAWILSLQLDVPLELATACVRSCGEGEVASADNGALAEIRNKIAEAFKYGKRKALQELKRVVGRYPALNFPKDDVQAVMPSQA